MIEPEVYERSKITRMVDKVRQAGKALATRRRKTLEDS
jgi:hypothetical protein